MVHRVTVTERNITSQNKILFLPLFGAVVVTAPRLVRSGHYDAYRLHTQVYLQCMRACAWHIMVNNCYTGCC